MGCKRRVLPNHPEPHPPKNGSLRTMVPAKPTKASTKDVFVLGGNDLPSHTHEVSSGPQRKRRMKR